MLDVLMRASDKSALLAAAKKECSVVVAGLLQFVVEVDAVTATQPVARRRTELRRLLLRMPRNYLFYYSTLEIEIGSMDHTNFDNAYKLLVEWRDELYPYLARLAVPTLFHYVATNKTAKDDIVRRDERRPRSLHHPRGEAAKTTTTTTKRRRTRRAARARRGRPTADRARLERRGVPSDL